LNLFLCTVVLKKKNTEKFTDPNKVLLVFGRRTDANLEDWYQKHVLLTHLTGV